jgi:VWFA-related protein
VDPAPERRSILRLLIAALVALAVPLAGQTPQSKPQTPVFKSATDLVTTEVKAWDKDHKFVPGLGPNDFTVLEDGVRQTIQTFSAFIGGRPVGVSAATAAPARGGLILPATAPPRDTSGRIFLVFIDDLHLQASDTPRVRQWLRDIRDTLIHDNDLVGFVSSGYSSIQGGVAYDPSHRRFNEVIAKVVGAADTPNAIISAPTTADGPAGLRHRASVAFSTVYDLLGQLEPIRDRTKALIYVSSGYDFNPHKDSRYREAQAKYSTTPEGVGGAPPGRELNDPNYVNPFDRGGQFLETDLVQQIAELVNTARRTNTTFFPIDPRGLLPAIPDISQQISPQEWLAHTDTQLSTLRTLADETNGLCVCNVNDPKPWLRQIDNLTSDYYLIGYVSTNPDPRPRRRRVEILVRHPDVRELGYAREYVRRPQ